MLAIISLLTVVILSLLVVRVATVALTLTGLSRQLARFQARSAFTGSGFTTTESERVVQHPVRRRIIMLLMLFGNAGFITAVSSLMLSFVTTDATTGITGTIWFRVLLLIAGLTALWLVAHSQWVDRRLSTGIAWALQRWSDLEVRDYAALLHLSSDYAVAEMVLERDDWLVGGTLREMKLSDEGVLVLGISKPSGEYLGSPRGHHHLAVDDTVILYGPRQVLADLDERRSGSQGNWKHFVSAEDHHRVEAEEDRQLAAASAAEDAKSTAETA